MRKKLFFKLVLHFKSFTTFPWRLRIKTSKIKLACAETVCLDYRKVLYLPRLMYVSLHWIWPWTR